MRRTLFLATGWAATAALAVTMTALVLSDGDGGGAAGGALTEDQVTKRLAAEDTTAVPSTVPANPSGAAATAAQGTPIVTKGGTLSVRCNPGQPHVMEHVTRITKPGWRIENQSDGLANSIALAHRLPNRVVTVISNAPFTAIHVYRTRPGEVVVEKGKGPVRLYSLGQRGRVGETIVVLSWCEAGKPKWVLSDK